MAVDCFTFGTAQYRPVLDGPGLRTPLPQAPLVGEWVHIPYGSQNKFEVDGGRTHTSWSVRVWLPDLTAFSEMKSFSGTFRILSTPFGYFNAVLRSMEGFQLSSEGYYLGTCVWEWA